MTSRQSLFDARRKAAGWRRIPVWCDPPTLAALAVLSPLWGSEHEAIRRAVRIAAAAFRGEEARKASFIDIAVINGDDEYLGYHGPKARDR